MRDRKVITSLHNDAVDRCVDIFVRSDGTYGYDEFRRDIEDQGTWFVTRHNQRGVYPSREDAMAAAVAEMAWLRKRQARDL